jgi:hypothetical protein
MTAWSKFRIEIAVGWSLTNLAGRVIWANTVVGRGEGTYGSVYSYQKNVEEIAQIAISEVMTATFHEMQQSPEIRDFALQAGGKP